MHGIQFNKYLCPLLMHSSKHMMGAWVTSISYVGFTRLTVPKLTGIRCQKPRTPMLSTLSGSLAIDAWLVEITQVFLVFCAVQFVSALQKSREKVTGKRQPFQEILWFQHDSEGKKLAVPPRRSWTRLDCNAIFLVVDTKRKGILPKTNALMCLSQDCVHVRSFFSKKRTRTGGGVL